MDEVGQTGVTYITSGVPLPSGGLALMWIIFKVFIEFVTILLLFSVLVSWPRDLSSSSESEGRSVMSCSL